MYKIFFVFSILFLSSTSFKINTAKFADLPNNEKLALLLETLKNNIPSSFLLEYFKMSFETEEYSVNFNLSKTTVTNVEKFTVTELYDKAPPYRLSVSLDSIGIDGRMEYIYFDKKEPLARGAHSWSILQRCNFNVKSKFITNINIDKNNKLQIPIEDFSIEVEIGDDFTCSQNYKIDLMRIVLYINTNKALISSQIKQDTVNVLNKILQSDAGDDGGDDDGVDTPPGGSASLSISSILFVSSLCLLIFS